MSLHFKEPIIAGLRNENFYRQGALLAMLGLWVSIAFSQALIEITSVAAIVFWLLPKLIWKRPFQFDRSLALPLGLFVMLCLLSLIWTEAPKASVKGVFKVLKSMFIFLIASEAFQPSEAQKKFNLTFSLFYILLCFDGFFQLIFKTDLIRHIVAQPCKSGLRISACFKTYGLFANYLICTIPLIGAFALTAKQKGRALKSLGYLLLLTAALVLLFLTRSRGAILSLVLALFIFLLLLRRYKILIAGVGLVFLSLFMIPKTMIIHEDVSGREQSLIERYYLWDRALNVIKAKPLTGTGINTYTATHANYDKTQNWRVRDYYAHNGYLQAMAETGIPSMVCFVWFLAVYFFKTSRIPSLSSTLAAEVKYRIQAINIGILSFLIFMATDTVFHNGQAVTLFWYLLGVGIANADKWGSGSGRGSS